MVTTVHDKEVEEKVLFCSVENSELVFLLSKGYIGILHLPQKMLLFPVHPSFVYFLFTLSQTGQCSSLYLTSTHVTKSCIAFLENCSGKDEGFPNICITFFYSASCSASVMLSTEPGTSKCRAGMRHNESGSRLFSNHVFTMNEFINGR